MSATRHAPRTLPTLPSASIIFRFFEAVFAAVTFSLARVGVPDRGRRARGLDFSCHASFPFILRSLGPTFAVAGFPVRLAAMTKDDTPAGSGCILSPGRFLLAGEQKSWSKVFRK